MLQPLSFALTALVMTAGLLVATSDAEAGVRATGDSLQNVQPGRTAPEIRAVQPGRTAPGVKAAQPVKASQPVKAAQPVKTSQPIRTAEPVLDDRQAYEGSYDMAYARLKGELEVCSGLRVYEICVPVTIDAPLEGGEVTEASLEFILLELEAAIEAALGSVPAALLAAIEGAVVEYLFPELVVTMNARVDNLPLLMDLTQNPVMPTYFTANFTRGDGSLLYGIGEVEIATGVFKLIPDYVQGQMDPANGYNGFGTADFPIRFQESVEVGTPWGVEQIWLTAAGTMGADFSLARQ